jgi:hypothetical protein
LGFSVLPGSEDEILNLDCRPLIPLDLLPDRGNTATPAWFWFD